MAPVTRTVDQARPEGLENPRRRRKKRTTGRTYRQYIMKLVRKEGSGMKVSMRTLAILESMTLAALDRLAVTGVESVRHKSQLTMSADVERAMLSSTMTEPLARYAYAFAAKARRRLETPA